MPKLKDLWNEQGYLIEKHDDENGLIEIRVDAHFKGENPDPIKRAERQAQAMNEQCPTCNKIVGEHTPEEIRVCARQGRERPEKLFPPTESER